MPVNFPNELLKIINAFDSGGRGDGVSAARFQTDKIESVADGAASKLASKVKKFANGIMDNGRGLAEEDHQYLIGRYFSKSMDTTTDVNVDNVQTILSSISMGDREAIIRNYIDESYDGLTKQVEQQFPGYGGAIVKVEDRRQGLLKEVQLSKKADDEGKFSSTLTAFGKSVTGQASTVFDSKTGKYIPVVNTPMTLPADIVQAAHVAAQNKSDSSGDLANDIFSTEVDAHKMLGELTGGRGTIGVNTQVAGLPDGQEKNSIIAANRPKIMQTLVAKPFAAIRAVHISAYSDYFNHAKALVNQWRGRKDAKTEQAMTDLRFEIERAKVEDIKMAQETASTARENVFGAANAFFPNGTEVNSLINNSATATTDFITNSYDGLLTYLDNVNRAITSGGERSAVDIMTAELEAVAKNNEAKVRVAVSAADVIHTQERGASGLLQDARAELGAKRSSWKLLGMIGDALDERGLSDSAKLVDRFSTNLQGWQGLNLDMTNPAAGKHQMRLLGEDVGSISSYFDRLNRVIIENEAVLHSKDGAKMKRDLGTSATILLSGLLEAKQNSPELFTEATNKTPEWNRAANRLNQLVNRLSSTVKSLAGWSGPNADENVTALVSEFAMKKRLLTMLDGTSGVDPDKANKSLFGDLIDMSQAVNRNDPDSIKRIQEVLSTMRDLTPTALK